MVKWRGNIDAVGLVRESAEQLEETAHNQQLQISIDVDPQMLM